MSALATPLFPIRCHYCSRYRLPSDIIALGSASGANRCRYCEERHQQALRFFAGQAPPPNCQECGADFVALSERLGDIRVSLQWKDGIYQVLCIPCSNAYIPKRLDLFGDTMYGHKKKLKGAK